MKNPTLSQQRVNQHKSNYNQGESNRHININIQNVFIVTHKIPRFNLNAKVKLSIARTTSIVNTFHFSLLVFLEKLGTIKTVPSQPADKLINKSAKIEFQTANAFINNHHNTI